MYRSSPSTSLGSILCLRSVSGGVRVGVAGVVLVAISLAAPVRGGETASLRDAESDNRKSATAISDTDRRSLARLPEQLATHVLTRVVRVHPKVLSGAAPNGPAAFAELRQLGVQTIISVDGLAPDVAAAARAGLRYVHLPHGYAGISTRRAKQLAKAVQELPGTIYIHCHHGQHRSPAAAGVACVTAGWIKPSTARALLDLAGTSPHYQGLYRSVAAAKPVADEVLRQLEVEFLPAVEVPPMVEAMAQIDVAYGRLLELEANAWQAPATHPDLDPAYQALLIREQLAELLRTEEVGNASTEFQELMGASVAAADRLEQELRSAETGLQPKRTIKKFTSQRLRLEASCTDCHRSFRD